MAEKILNTRIQLKYDTLANWEASTFNLKAGELAIVSLGNVKDGTTAGEINQHPVLFKVGTGNHTFSQLPFASALAADVYAWAKASDVRLNGKKIEFVNGDSVVKTIDINFITESEAKGYITEALGAYSTTEQMNAAIKVEKDRAELAESSLNDRIAVFEGTGEGSVAAAKAAADAAQADVNALKTKVGTVAEGKTVVELIETAQDAADKAQGDVNTLAGKVGTVAEGSTVVGMIGAVQGEVDTVEGKVGNVDSLETTNKTVVGAINEVLTAVGTGGTAAVVTITTDTTTDGALKSYTVKQGDTTVGVIDIPKDMVVESGEVVVDPAGQEAGTYIKLKLANVTDPLYINVGRLVDIYTAEADASQVQLSITNNKISAAIVAGSINTVELADNAVTTAKIADANVTKAKLSSEVQGLLDNAATEADLTLAENRITALEGKFGGAEGSVEDQIADAKQEAINAAAADATTKANAAEANAKAYADGLAGNYATAAQGAKADSALQEITTTENGGLKVTNKNQIDIDTDVTFVFDCGSASTLID